MSDATILNVVNVLALSKVNRRGILPPSRMRAAKAILGNMRTFAHASDWSGTSCSAAAIDVFDPSAVLLFPLLPPLSHVLAG